MWPVINRVGQLLGLVSTEPPVDVDAIAAVLDTNDNINEEEEPDESTIINNDDVVCQHQVGIVTALFDNHGYIKMYGTVDSDDRSSQLFFKRQDGPDELQVGNRVVYLAFRMSEESGWIVRKVLYVENELWDKMSDTEEEQINNDQPVIKEECETAYKHVISKVTRRRGRTVFTDSIQFCLDSVHIDFIPVEGDWLVLESLMQTEQTSDTLLMVDRVSPLRSQRLDGKVSHWSFDTHQGIVDGAVVFNKEACESGYLPRVGDQVRVYSIESDQGQLTWRAVHVVPSFGKHEELLHDPQALATLLQNKHGIVISEDTNCGVLNIGQETQITIEMKNEGKTEHLLLATESTAQESQFQLVEPLITDTRVICPQESLCFVIKVKGRFVGRSTELVVFQFEGFKIGRQLAVDVQNESLTTSLSDRSSRITQNVKHKPITARKLLATRNGFIVPGVRPIKPASFVPVRLGMFVIPEKLVNLVLGSEASSKKEEVIGRLLEYYKFLRGPISAYNYVLYWDTLINLEELEHAVNIARFNTQASLYRVEDYLSLEIPGLVERRPSLIVGDKVIVRQAWSDENSWDSDCKGAAYEGYVHKVLSNEVLMKFNPNFHDLCSGVYSISFEASRTKFRREHQAVHVAFRNLSVNWLFPSRVSYQLPQVVIVEEEDYLSPLKANDSGNYVAAQENKVDNNNMLPMDKSDNSNVRDVNMSDKYQNETTNEAPSNILDLEDKLNNVCDKIIDNIKSIGNHALTTQELETEIFNDDKHMSSGDLMSVEKSIDDILNTETQILNTGENFGKIPCKEPVEERVKSKVSETLETVSKKEENHHKTTSPRVPVVARFLENGNCPSIEKSPKEVNNMLQQLARLSTNEKLPPNNSGMKTLQEIEKLLLNSSNTNVLDGIQPLTQEKIEKQPLQQSVSSSDRVMSAKEKENASLNNSRNTDKVMGEKTEKIVKNTVNEVKKCLKHSQNKIKWNSNIEMKVGNVKEACDKIKKGKRKKLKWFNPLLNHFQKEAVRNILKGEARPLPYVIFGPPGTGKTISLVEAVLQIYFLIPESRLLIGTPSNSSADLVCERLLDSELLAPGDLLRLVSYNYANQGRIIDKLKPYCGNADIKANDDLELSSRSQEGVVNMSRHAIGRHRITIGTCNTLGVLYQMGFPRGHFTHVIIDEAGQATEPEILIPLAFLHSSYGQAVLAGDPLQLGPVVLSKVAEHFGLGESLLSRLLLRTPYCRDTIGYPSTGGYNPHLVTQLVYNYRSLPEILDLPNQMFYNGDLIAQVSEEFSEEVCVLAKLREILPKRPNSRPPAIVFHGVRGTNCHAPDSPSWYNPHEAVQAAMYLQSLYASGLSPDQCGIITPYHAQALKIRQMLDTLEMRLPKVGSVEEFQGQERIAMILSTVRSSPRLIEADVRHTVGFVASPRRLNVAITRARALLIILGNPHLLARDRYWRTVLTYCVRNGAYTGCDQPALNI